MASYARRNPFRNTTRKQWKTNWTHILLLWLMPRTISLVIAGPLENLRKKKQQGSSPSRAMRYRQECSVHWAMRYRQECSVHWAMRYRQECSVHWAMRYRQEFSVHWAMRYRQECSVHWVMRYRQECSVHWAMRYGQECSVHWAMRYRQECSVHGQVKQSINRESLFCSLKYPTHLHVVKPRISGPIQLWLG